MLGSQQFRRRHKGGLIAAGDSLQHGALGDGGLAGAYVALDEPVHGFGRCHVRADLQQASFLRIRQLVGQFFHKDFVQVAGKGNTLAPRTKTVLAQHQGGLQVEQFFVDQAVPGLGIFLPALRIVDVPQRVFQAAEICALYHRRRQGLLLSGELPFRQFQRQPGEAPHLLLGHAPR